MTLHDVYIVHASDHFAGEIREFLHRLGWRMVAFPGAFECMLAIADGRPDLVICDLDSPEGAILAGRLLFGEFDVPCLAVTEGAGFGYETVERSSRQPRGFWTVLPNAPVAHWQGAIVEALLSRLDARPRELESLGTPALPTLDAEFREQFWKERRSDLVLTPKLSVLAVSWPYARDVGMDATAMMGRSLFDLFPDNPEDGNATGTTNLAASLERAHASRRPDAMPLQRYDVRVDGGTGPFEERWWFPVNYPVCRGDELCYLVHRVSDVTRFVKLRRAWFKPLQAVA